MLLDFWQLVAPYVLPFYYLSILVVVVNILLENRNPLKTHSYLLLLLLLPILGIIIYLFFGQKFRKRKIFNKRKLINSAFGRDYATMFLDKGKEIDFPENKILRQSERLISFLNHDLSPLSSANRIEILQNGEEKFPRLIKALKEAKRYIHMEYYIFSYDDVGKEVVAILMEKAQSGIEVKLIIDAVGSIKLKKSVIQALRQAKVEVQQFRPVIFPLFTSKLNYRDHRKIVVIDGTIGFTGGINLNDRYLNNGKHPIFWRDTHLLIQGEAVKTLQLLFLLNWHFVSGNDTDPVPKYFPKTKIEGNHHAQINASAPDWELASIMDSVFLAINSAQDNIRIATPYFIPSESIMNAILIASRSAVDVELMIPYESDSWIVQAASLSFITQLLENNVRVFFYQKGFLHSKTITVDDRFASVGTANMDHRSFDINYEVNTYLYDQELCKELNDQFNRDKSDCTEITLKDWKKRKLSKKLLESVCRLLAPLL